MVLNHSFHTQFVVVYFNPLKRTKFVKSAQESNSAQSNSGTKAHPRFSSDSPLTQLSTRIKRSFSLSSKIGAKCQIRVTLLHTLKVLLLSEHSWKISPYSKANSSSYSFSKKTSTVSNTRKNFLKTEFYKKQKKQIKVQGKLA